MHYFVDDVAWKGMAQAPGKHITLYFSVARIERTLLL
jgi:hypothetical protein